MVLILQLGRLNLLELLRQSRHRDRGRRGEKEIKRAGETDLAVMEKNREEKKGTAVLAGYR